jgi:hypothetical protein
MSDVNQNYNMPSDIKPALPSGINVLTILTFIASGLSFCYYLWYIAGGAKKSLDGMEEMVNSSKFDSMPGFLKKMYSPEMIAQARTMYENRVGISLINILGIVLCVIGTIQMRKLRQQGYYLYVVGEIMPLIAMTVFVGVGWIGGMGGIFATIFVVLFIILYTAQRKHLVNK